MEAKSNFENYVKIEYGMVGLKQLCVNKISSIEEPNIKPLTTIINANIELYLYIEW